MRLVSQMHSAVCDGCKSVFKDGEGESFFHTKEELYAKEEFPGPGKEIDGKVVVVAPWTHIEDKDFCPSCREQAESYMRDLEMLRNVDVQKHANRKLASIVCVENVFPIEGADKIGRATIVGMGWNVVVGKDELHAGDMAVFYEIDSFLPPNDERYAFLRDRCLRKFVSKSGNVIREGIKIKSVKFKGVVSQGLLIPLDKFVGPDKELQLDEEDATPENCVSEDGKPLTKEELAGMKVCSLYYKRGVGDRNEDGSYAVYENVKVEVGSDLTALLKVEHYDEVKESLAPVTGSNPISADAYGKFPTDYIPKTDEDRIQADTSIIEKFRDRKFEVTVKADGSSGTFFFSPKIDAENPFGVCSRNLRLKPKTEAGVVPLLWKMAEKYQIEKALRSVTDETQHDWAIQGEICGPGLQKNRNKDPEHIIKVFRIWDITEQKFVDPKVRREFCKKWNIPHVEVIAEEMQVFHEYPNVESILKFAEGKTAEGNEREGLVFKTCDDGEFKSWKAVSNRYLLKQED